MRDYSEPVHLERTLYHTVTSHSEREKERDRERKGGRGERKKERTEMFDDIFYFYGYMQLDILG